MRMIFGTIAAAVLLTVFAYDLFSGGYAQILDNDFSPAETARALAVDFALLPLLLALAAGVILPRKQDGL